jgi:hypothetical protein
MQQRKPVRNMYMPIHTEETVMAEELFDALERAYARIEQRYEIGECSREERDAAYRELEKLFTHTQR